jgi:hypothetical protein
MIWTHNENVRKQIATEDPRMGTEGKTKERRSKQRWTDGVRWSRTNHGLTEEGARDRNAWRNLVLGEGDRGTVEKSLDDLDDDDNDDDDGGDSGHHINYRIRICTNLNN